MTLHVELVVPDREIWSGSARMVIAKTPDGDLGILGSHPPVLGILAEGSVVRILDPESSGSGSGGSGSGSSGSGGSGSGGSGAGDGNEVVAAISGGFLSVAQDRVSILARHAELSQEIDVSAARAEIESATGEETAEVKYARARLRASGEQA